MLSNRQERWQVQHRFNLDLNKEDEHQLHEIIHSLKRKRSFMGVIRDGIRLVLDLRQGQTEVLRELFPWVLEQAISMPAETSSADLLKDHFEELKLLIARGSMPSEVPLSPRIEPENDWLDVEFKEQTASEDVNPGWNLSIHMASMADSYAALAPEMIWYGVRNGHINVSAALAGDMLTYQQLADGVKAGKIDAEKLPEAIAKKVKQLLVAE